VSRRTPFLILAVLAALAWAGLSASFGRTPSSPAMAVATQCEFDGVERIVAIGDVHGAYDRFIEILKVAGIIDDAGKWAGGKTHLVQLGDVVDRGPDSRKVLDFMQKLERDANSAGGHVHSLIGNHEAMRLLGDVRYVTPGEFAAFETKDSKDTLRQAVEASTTDTETRKRLMAETPLGQLEMMRAFASGAPYGNYIRRLNAVVRINGVLFLHGGISPAVAPLSCTKINDTVRKDLSSDLEKTKNDPLVTLTAREDGPLWYRGLIQEPETFEPELTKILAAQQATAIVVAHTVIPGGRVGVRFGGKVIGIDTGMQQAYIPDGRASALEIKGGVITAIYTDKREVISGGRVPGPGGPGDND
jgi:Calcineurin-like phosphoesterase